MKHYRFIIMPFYAAMLLLLISCGESGEKKTSTDSDTTFTDTNTPAVVPEVNTIVTTPQNLMVVKHKVADFEKWKPSYDAHDSMRLANGLHNYVIGRGIDDPNMVLVAVKVDDMTKAKAFAKDPSLKKAMQKGGVTGTPTFSFVTMVFQDTAVISSDIRSRTTFTVKDWDAWRKSFEEGKKERLDNGITERALGYNTDDNKKVELVVAITDTARARAYWESDMLKKRRAAGGVTSEPNRFVFRVVQRY